MSVVNVVFVFISAMRGVAMGPPGPMMGGPTPPGFMGPPNMPRPPFMGPPVPGPGPQVMPMEQHLPTPMPQPQIPAIVRSVVPLVIQPLTLCLAIISSQLPLFAAYLVFTVHNIIPHYMFRLYGHHQVRRIYRNAKIILKLNGSVNLVSK
jgi:hypothetical protein